MLLHIQKWVRKIHVQSYSESNWHSLIFKPGPLEGICVCRSDCVASVCSSNWPLLTFLSSCPLLFKKEDFLVTTWSPSLFFSKVEKQKNETKIRISFWRLNNIKTWIGIQKQIFNKDCWKLVWFLTYFIHVNACFHVINWLLFNITLKKKKLWRTNKLKLMIVSSKSNSH